MPQDKNKYLIPGVAGVLFFIAAATVTIVLIVKRSGKDDSATTRQQTKEELKEPVDPCVTLLAEYVKAGESGMAEEELKSLYAKGFAQCPTVFLPLQQQDELPKVGVVRARLFKRQEEKKTAEVDVNTAEKEEQGDVSDVTSQALGTKGNNAANTLKPATVPQAKNDSTVIKNNMNDKNTALGSKGSIEETDSAKHSPVPLVKNDAAPESTSSTVKDNSGDKSKVQPASKAPVSDGELPSSNPDTTEKQQATVEPSKTSSPAIPPKATDLSETKSSNGDPNNANKPPPTPKELRANAKIECMEMINEMVSSNVKGNFFDAFTDEQRERIKKLAEEGLIPSSFNDYELVRQFWESKMQKFMKTGNAKEAQETYAKRKLSAGQKPDETNLVTNWDEYKFWKAIASDNWAEATRLFNHAMLYLPSHVRDAMESNSEKLKLLKELNDAQMDALLEYCAWDTDLQKCIGGYKLTKDEWQMADREAEYKIVAEKMNLLKEDIHKDFDFALPALPEKKSLMQELDAKLINKTPAFEAAFKRLRADKSLGLMLVIDALKELKEPQDQISLLETVIELANHSYLADLLLAAAKQLSLDQKIHDSLRVADFRDAQQLVTLNEAFKWMHACGGTPYELARFELWMLFIALVQSLSPRFDEVTQNGKRTLIGDLHEMSFQISLYQIDKLGEYLSRSNIGAEGTKLVEQCALCLEKNYELNLTVKWIKYSHDFAQGYLKIYKSVKGANMEDKDILDQVAALR